MSPMMTAVKIAMKITPINFPKLYIIINLVFKMSSDSLSKRQYLMWIGGGTMVASQAPWLLGFTAAGAAKGSVAAWGMGPAVAKGSAFAYTQSMAATGLFTKLGLMGASASARGAITQD